MLEVPSNGVIRSYLGRCRHALHLWYNQWRSSSSFKLAPLYYRHALIQLIILPMQHAHLLTNETLSATTACIYQHCLDYMEAFLSLLQPSDLANYGNSMFISASYIVVLSLRLTNLGTSFSFIEPSTLSQLISNVISSIQSTSSFSSHQTASMYGNLLQMLFDQSKGVRIQQGDSTSTSVFDISDTTSYAQSQVHLSSNSTVDQISNDNTSFYFDDAELMAWVNYHFANTE
jgi:hypothetical protein